MSDLENSCLLGIDFGSKRIGIAKSDSLGWTAQPLVVISRRSEQQDLDQIARLVEEHQVRAVVVGLPLNMDGTEGKAVEKVKKFIAALQERLGIPIYPWDERLTTCEAEEMLKNAAVKRKKRALIVDKVAAVFILKSYMDAHLKDTANKEKS